MLALIEARFATPLVGELEPELFLAALRTGALGPAVLEQQLVGELSPRRHRDELERAYPGSRALAYWRLRSTRDGPEPAVRRAVRGLAQAAIDGPRADLADDWRARALLILARTWSGPDRPEDLREAGRLLARARALHPRHLDVLRACYELDYALLLAAALPPDELRRRARALRVSGLAALRAALAAEPEHLRSRMEPELRMLRLDLTRCALHRGDAAEAELLAREELAEPGVLPGNDHRDELGGVVIWALQEQGRLEEARPWIERALQSGVERSQPLAVWVARALRALGDDARARAAVESALRGTQDPPDQDLLLLARQLGLPLPR
ncbi:MAG: hypothetical protein AB7N76_18980 [Planctomycetota bacterium]